MRIVCPKCELTGQIDAAPTGAKSRIACVRCATTFEAVFTDGQAQVQLPQSTQVAVLSETAANNNLLPGSQLAATRETQHEMALSDSLQIEAAPAVDVDYLTASPDFMPTETGEISLPDLLEENSQVRDEQSVEPQVQENAEEGSQTSIAAEAWPTTEDADVVSRPSSDAYGLGVRLMRVSPVWLLLAGLTFISFIVLCNWLIKPAVQTEDAASLSTATNNQATNQSVNRLTNSNSTAQSTANNQSARPTADSGVAFIATEVKASTAPPQATPAVEVSKEESAGAGKLAMPASSQSSSAAETKEGKVTLQVGSYNEAAQAEKRVVDLKSAGFEARSVAVEIPKRGTWYRVQSGRFINRDEAERYGRQLRDKGVVSNFITADIQE